MADFVVTEWEVLLGLRWLRGWLADNSIGCSEPEAVRSSNSSWEIQLTISRAGEDGVLWGWDAGQFVRALRRHLGVERLT